MRRSRKQVTLPDPIPAGVWLLSAVVSVGLCCLAVVCLAGNPVGWFGPMLATMGVVTGVSAVVQLVGFVRAVLGRKR